MKCFFLNILKAQRDTVDTTLGGFSSHTCYIYIHISTSVKLKVSSFHYRDPWLPFSHVMSPGHPTKVCWTPSSPDALGELELVVFSDGFKG